MAHSGMLAHGALELFLCLSDKHQDAGAARAGYRVEVFPTLLVAVQESVHRYPHCSWPGVMESQLCW